MLKLLSRYSRHRGAWLLLLLSALLLEGIALYFQHYLQLDPCVLCIYQRCVILGIAFAALIAMLKPRWVIYRLLALAIWLYCGVYGFFLAYQQAKLQFAPTLFDSCPVFTNFPSWLPLDKWLPGMFAASGNCSEKVWQFLTIEMSQWMMIIFAFYLIVGLLVLLAQLVKPAPISMWYDE